MALPGEAEEAVAPRDCLCHDPLLQNPHLECVLLCRYLHPPNVAILRSFAGKTWSERCGLSAAVRRAAMHGGIVCSSQGGAARSVTWSFDASSMEGAGPSPIPALPIIGDCLKLLTLRRCLKATTPAIVSGQAPWRWWLCLPVRGTFLQRQELSMVKSLFPAQSSHKHSRLHLHRAFLCGRRCGACRILWGIEYTASRAASLHSVHRVTLPTAPPLGCGGPNRAEEEAPLRAKDKRLDRP